MDIKVINQIKLKDDFQEPIIIKNFDLNKSVKDLKKRIYEELKLKNPINNLGLFYTTKEKERKKKLSLSEENKPLNYYEKISEENTIIYIKNIGTQISYKLVYLIEYLGPLILTLLFFTRLFYSKNIFFIQKLYFIMSFFHYSKRIYETLFIHIFSHDTMPIKNLYKNCIYYWGIYGILCNYFIFHPNYKPIYFFIYLRYLYVFLFFYSEKKNYNCHIILKQLKEQNNGKKNIPPNKEGFQYYTYANYFWEFFSWVSLSLLSLHWTIIFFTFCGFYQMREWALKKHKSLKDTFGDRYPKGRTAFIPFIL